MEQKVIVPSVMWCVFYLPISEVGNKPSSSTGGVNKVLQMHELTKLRDSSVLLLTPCMKSSEAEKRKEKAFVLVDPWLFQGSGWCERDEEVT